MAIKLVTRKVENGYRIIVRVNALTMDRLPKAYLHKGPFVVMSRGGRVLHVVNKRENIALVVGHGISEETYQQVIRDIKAAGTRLMEIRKHEKEKGLEVFTW